MRRLFWVALGATAGAMIARKVTRTAEALTPQSVAESLAESITILGEAVRDFAADIRDGMREREAELTQAVGLDAVPDGRAAVLDGRVAVPDARAAVGDPAPRPAARGR